MTRRGWSGQESGPATERPLRPATAPETPPPSRGAPKAGEVNRGPDVAGAIVCGAIASLMRATDQADPRYRGMAAAYEAAMTAAGFDLPLEAPPPFPPIPPCSRCGRTGVSMGKPDGGDWVCAGWDADPANPQRCEVAKARAAKPGQTPTEVAAG